MTVQKLSVSLQPDLVSRARQQAEAHGQSLSSFVGEAVERRLKLVAARHLLTEWESDHGPISPTEREGCSSSQGKPYAAAGITFSW